MRKMPAAFVLVMVASIVSYANLSPRTQAVRPGTGSQWLSWSDAQRVDWTTGFVSGYEEASLEACRNSDKLFEVSKSHTLGDGTSQSDLPSARCLAAMETFSGASGAKSNEFDATAYVRTITSFYESQPDFGQIPFVNVMVLLSDKNHKSVAELTRMAASGKLQPLR